MKKAAVKPTLKKTRSKTKLKTQMNRAPGGYPRHSMEKALRIPNAIFNQNAGKPCTPADAAKYLGLTSPKGPFGVEIASAKKYGFLESSQQGKIQPTDLARKIIKPESENDSITAYQEALQKATTFSDVYQHYRGENLPDDQFLNNTLESKFKVPQSSIAEFKQLFIENLQLARLIDQSGDKVRIIDVGRRSDLPQNLAKGITIDPKETCFVMQPFSHPFGGYYATIYKPAIDKTGLTAIRADAELFATGKIIDQVWRGINGAKVLVAELTSRNANVFYELGLAHALKKPVVLVSANEADVPFDLRHIRVIYYDTNDPFWGEKLINKVAENIISALKDPEEALFKYPQ